MVSDRILLALVAIVLTGFAFALLAGHGPWAGPELVAVEGSHGLNWGDLPIIAAWGLGVGCCWRLWPGRGRD